MRGSKRHRPAASAPAASHAAPVPLQPFAIPRRGPSIPDPVQEEAHVKGGEPKPYGRGTAAGAIAFIADPKRCKASLEQDISSSTTKGPTASRKSLWETLARKAGYSEPFHLEPNMVMEVMGALKLANFRSAQLYLDNAKGEHIAQGYPWTDRLQQCYRAAVRSCNRHLGSPKQAAPLPLAELALLPHSEEPLVRGGPKWPVRSALLASWWLLREIEASYSLTSHVDIDEEAYKVSWRLPSSKTDWKALGATRSHTCSCEFTTKSQCPYHSVVDHIKALGPKYSGPMFPGSDGLPATKTGWADTFEALGKALGLQCSYPNGARCFTGHTARATGAVHLASNQVELWRIQLFGRWGSQVFLHYIRDAPLKQLDKLALETSAQMSIEAAKNQLQDLLRRAQSGLAAVVACPSQEMLDDCETANIHVDPPKPTDVNIVNTSGGKVHRTMIFGDDFHPREWKTRCAWHFGGPHTTYMVSAEAPSAGEACKKCFPEFRHQAQDNSSSASTESDNSSSS
eukprot:s2001_g8.t1